MHFYASNFRLGAIASDWVEQETALTVTALLTATRPPGETEKWIATLPGSLRSASRQAAAASAGAGGKH